MTFFESFCDLRLYTWDTDYISDNWEQQYEQIHCDLWIQSDGDSIRNSCDVLLFTMKSECGVTVRPQCEPITIFQRWMPDFHTDTDNFFSPLHRYFYKEKIQDDFEEGSY